MAFPNLGNPTCREKGPTVIHGHSCLSKYAYQELDTYKPLGVHLDSKKNRELPFNDMAFYREKIVIWEWLNIDTTPMSSTSKVDPRVMPCSLRARCGLQIIWHISCLSCDLMANNHSSAFKAQLCHPLLSWDCSAGTASWAGAAQLTGSVCSFTLLKKMDFRITPYAHHLTATQATGTLSHWKD